MTKISDLGKAFKLGMMAANKNKNKALNSRQLAEDDKWITLHPNGKGLNTKNEKIKGTPVLIDGQGRILGGLGGKFKGKKVGELNKTFVGPMTPTRSQKSNARTSTKRAAAKALNNSNKKAQNQPPQKPKQNALSVSGIGRSPTDKENFLKNNFNIGNDSECIFGNFLKRINLENCQQYYDDLVNNCVDKYNNAIKNGYVDDTAKKQILSDALKDTLKKYKQDRAPAPSKKGSYLIYKELENALINGPVALDASKDTAIKISYSKNYPNSVNSIKIGDQKVKILAQPPVSSNEKLIGYLNDSNHPSVQYALYKDVDSGIIKGVKQQNHVNTSGIRSFIASQKKNTSVKQKKTTSVTKTTSSVTPLANAVNSNTGSFDYQEHFAGLLSDKKGIKKVLRESGRGKPYIVDMISPAQKQVLMNASNSSQKDQAKALHQVITEIARSVPRVSQQSLSKMTNKELVDNFKKNLITTSRLTGYKMSPSLNTGSATQFLTQQLGFNELPRLVDTSEFQKLSKDSNYIPIFRGVKNTRLVKAQDMIKSMKEANETYLGDGMYGDGLYFSSSIHVALSYAARDTRNVTPALIDKSKAKVIDFDDLFAKIKSKGDDLTRIPTGSSHGFSGNYSVFALKYGYNCIKVKASTNRSGSDYYIPLDRSCLVFEK